MSIAGSLDSAENCLKTLFFGHPLYTQECARTPTSTHARTRTHSFALCAPKEIWELTHSNFLSGWLGEKRGKRDEKTEIGKKKLTSEFLLSFLSIFRPPFWPHAHFHSNTQFWLGYSFSVSVRIQKFHSVHLNILLSHTMGFIPSQVRTSKNVKTDKLVECWPASVVSLAVFLLVFYYS